MPSCSKAAASGLAASCVATPRRSANGWHATWRLPEVGLEAASGIGRSARLVGCAAKQRAAVRRVREPIAAIRVGNNIVRRIETLALKALGEGAGRTVVLVAYDSPGQVLAGDLAALE